MRENIHTVGRQQNACFLFEELCIPSAQELVINCKYVIKFYISLCSHPFLFPTKNWFTQMWSWNTCGFWHLVQKKQYIFLFLQFETRNNRGTKVRSFYFPFYKISTLGRLDKCYWDGLYLFICLISWPINM